MTQLTTPRDRGWKTQSPSSENVPMTPHSPTFLGLSGHELTPGRGQTHRGSLASPLEGTASWRPGGDVPSQGWITFVALKHGVAKQLGLTKARVVLFPKAHTPRGPKASGWLGEGPQRKTLCLGECVKLHPAICPIHVTPTTHPCPIGTKWPSPPPPSLSRTPHPEECDHHPLLTSADSLATPSSRTTPAPS